MVVGNNVCHQIYMLDNSCAFRASASCSLCVSCVAGWQVLSSFGFSYEWSDETLSGTL